MSLTEELADFVAGFNLRAPADRRAAMETATRELAASGLAERARGIGDTAPDFTLPDATGQTVALRDLLAHGSVVLTFYRGGWCPYCNLELRAYQRILPELNALGASLVAISPQIPDKSLSTAEKNALTFPVLSDVGLHVAAAFGLAFDLPAELQPFYAASGNVLPVVNGDGAWRLPIPATYVIGKDGRIMLASVDPDYRNRLDPMEVLAALASVPAA
jgi:peroxiredoxin